MLLNQNIDKLRTWLITVPSTTVGYSYSHNRLSCRHQYHQFCNHWQNLTLESYRFPFNTSSFARFRDCGLLRLHLLVLSHALSCGLGARSCFRTIGYFASPKSYTLLLTWLFSTMPIFVCMSWMLNERRGVRLTIRTFWVRPNHRHSARFVIS